MSLARRLSVLAALLTAVPLEAQMSAEPVRFRRLSIPDPQMNGIEAASLLVPVGWNVEGGVVWLHDFSVLANLRMRIGDPRSGAALEFLPLQNFTWMPQTMIPIAPGTNYLGNVFHPPLEPVPFVQAFYMRDALAHLQGARVAGAQELPAVASEVARALGGMSQVRATRIRYQYMAGGKAWEEDVILTLTYTQGPTGVIWSAHTAYAFRAPAGALDRVAPVLAAMVGSFRVSESWFAGYSYVQQLFMNRQAQGIANAAALSATITRNSEEIRRMFSDSYREHSASQDRISRGFSEAIRGVETYREPATGRDVQLPHGYAEAWVNNRGEYLLSPQVGFDPNPGSDSTWTRMGRPGR